MIIVIDYGMGNLRSVSKALESVGARVQISSNPQEIERAKKLVLPGVGAFPAAMRELSLRELVGPVKGAISRGIPYLGICLGLQLLFERSDEGGGAKGLGVLSGCVRRFEAAGSSRLKIPHMGWNQVTKGKGECPLFRGIPDGSFFYFVHSYYVAPADETVTALESEYGIPFTAMVWRENLYATQFHPEKSQAVGLELLKNFVAL